MDIGMKNLSQKGTVLVCYAAIDYSQPILANIISTQ